MAQIISIIKHATEYIAPILSVIFNKCFVEGFYPDKLKIAKVIVLHKKGRKDIMGNYRPISLLNIFDKIFEKLIYKRIIAFLKKHDILFQFQFGFRENHSTTLALIDIVDKIKQNIDDKKYTVGIFLDLCKAFDTVDHTILLNKLEYC